MNTYFLLFFPSFCMLLAALIMWLIFWKIPEIWEQIFGEHTVIVADIGKTTFEKRRNFDNKLISSNTYLEFTSFFMKNEYHSVLFPAINTEEYMKRKEVDMKTTYEILQETIKTARKLGHLDKEEQRLKNLPISMPEIEGDGAIVELQRKIAIIRGDMERENELHQLELQIYECSEKLNAFLWLFEDEGKD